MGYIHSGNTAVQDHTNQTTQLENRFEYDGTAVKIFGIAIVNLLLSIITLGIYSFWGKTKMRKYIIGSIKLLEDRLEYTGTGGELFKGFLKALPIIFVVYLPFIIWNPEQHPIVGLWSISLFVLFMMAYYLGLRYLLSRITWRGVRGRLEGSALLYGSKVVLFTFAKILTLGLLCPVFDIKLYKYITNNTSYGNAKASFEGSACSLFKSNIITLLLAIPTLGISRLWYSAKLTRYTYSRTKINNLTLKATHTGSGLFGLYFVNALIIVFTFGLGFPIAIQRNIRYLMNNVSIIGDINTAGIAQSGEKLSTSGEGLAGALDIDMGM